MTLLEFLWITYAFLEYAPFMANDVSHFTVSIDDSFGEALRQARERSKLTQGAVAELMRERLFVDFHQTTVYKIESGKRGVTLGEGLALASIVGVSIEKLIEESKTTAVALRQAAERDSQDLRESLLMVFEAILQAQRFRSSLVMNLAALKQAEEGFPKNKRDRELETEAMYLLSAVNLDATLPLFAFENESRGK